MGVTLSNPDKVLWPAADGEPAHSKRDLALYLAAVAEAMMPHVEGRPCSVIRCPDGIGGQGFFQRHVGQGTSSLVTSVTVWGDRKPYIQLDRPEALIAMAQTGALELHPWNCLPFEPEIPGRLVFDLDPGPGVPFERVIEGALAIKERLEALGLVAFCKTTGGKGLHVVTPLAPEKTPLAWPEAKGFARDLCARLSAERPDRYLVNMAKAKREGRIFLDYLRNDRMSTAVAPYSPRARSGAPVSWPLEWKAVKPGLDPKAFNMRTAPALLKKGRAWAGYEDAARPLSAAIKKLGKGKAA
jgi:bifunctional non-homologous end joining protein LigD